MATVLGRIAESRRLLMRAAASRWRERMQEREQGIEKIAAMGIGAADPPSRKAQWSGREALKVAKGVPRFGERVIGTPDFVPFAPSNQAAGVAMPVARISTMPDGRHEAEGVATGLLLPGGLLLTNYHVFPGKQYANNYAANFGYARDERGIQAGSFFELDPDSLFLEDPDFDFVIVSIKDTGLSGERLRDITGTPLIESTGKILTGMPINIVQHPDGGPRQFAVSNNRLVDILPSGYLHYETDTDNGSSGSPVYNQDWELIALHHCGVPEMRGNDILRRDGRIWNEAHDSDSEIHWIANEGTRVSFIVERLKAFNPTGAGMQQRLAALLASTRDPVAVTASPAPVLTLPVRESTMSHNNFVFSGQVTVHVYAPPAPAAPIPTPTQSDAASSGQSPGRGEEKTLLFDTDYESRDGYDEEFLGLSLPAPSVARGRADEIYTVKDYETYFDDYRDVPKVDTQGLSPDDAMVLPYHHFSLVMNKSYRMCMWTASNCDYREDARQDRRARRDLGGENWRYDPRVPREFQLSDPDIYQPARRIDRGHIVRRDDNCWGAPGLPTEYANSDSYHWTNCTPQHEAFNQENPSDRSGRKVYGDGNVTGIWGHFEAEVAEQILANGGRAVLFAGPVLKGFFQPKDWGNGKIRIPKQFWKVVVVPESLRRRPTLLAYGYVFSQVSVVNRFGITYEALDLPEFTRQRKSLDEISEMTGVIFSQEVMAAKQP